MDTIKQKAKEAKDWVTEKGTEAKHKTEEEKMKA